MEQGNAGPGAYDVNEAEVARERVKLLVERLRDEDDKRGRVQAVTALAASGDPGVFHHLVAALDDPTWEVRHAAALALHSLRDPRAAEALVSRLLMDDDPDVRVAAALALGEVDDARVVEPLFVALQDIDHRVTVQAEQSLLRVLQHMEALTVPLAMLTDMDPKARIGAAALLGDLGDRRAVDHLLQTLGDADPEVRRHVAEALGKIRDPAAVDALILVMRNDDHLAVRLRAVRALGKIRDPRSVEPLAEMLDEEGPPLFRVWVAVALGKMGDPRAAAVLRSPTLRGMYSDVRMKAAEVLDHIRELQARRGEAEQPDLEAEHLARDILAFMGRWGWRVRQRWARDGRSEVLLQNDRALLGGVCLLSVLPSAVPVDMELLSYVADARRAQEAWKAILVAHDRFTPALYQQAQEQTIELLHRDEVLKLLGVQPGGR